MMDSAISSSSSVLSPGRTAAPSSSRTRRVMRPHSTILSISSGDLISIILTISQSGQDARGDLAGVGRAVDPADRAGPLVIVEERLGLADIAAEPFQCFFGLIVFADGQPGAIAVAESRHFRGQRNVVIDRAAFRAALTTPPPP